MCFYQVFLLQSMEENVVSLNKMTLYLNEAMRRTTKLFKVDCFDRLIANFLEFQKMFCFFKALEYARNVPKPAVKARPNQYNSYEVSAQLSPGASGKSRPTKNSPTPTQTVDVIDIRTLEQRHLQERKNTDKIRQNMESVLSQKAH